MTVTNHAAHGTQATEMKLPYCEDFYRVTLATSQHMLTLGGPAKEDPRATYRDFATRVATRANVRGALVGRNVSFPGPEDPVYCLQRDLFDFVLVAHEEEGQLVARRLDVPKDRAA